jgi:hypothetical protein
MGRKSSSKGVAPRAPEPPAPKGTSPLLYVGIIVLVVGVAAFALSRGGDPAGGSPAATTDPATPPKAAPASPEAEEAARTLAAMGPHKQSALPPIPLQAGYAPPRPASVITAAYEFAAEHPEILSYVPCFCGCERSGHSGNHDCFVESRASNGDVVAWDPHGVECAVCIDVATRSRQMHSSGASVRDIRTAIEKEFAGSPVMTPTPKPPAHDH